MERDDNKRQPALGAYPCAGTGAEAAGRAWRRISDRLAVLIGESGFCALLGRALRMQAPRFPWLSVDPARRSIEMLLTALEQDLACAEAAEAAIAQTELLHTFTKQLSTLIGETLTARLLAQAVAADRDGPDDAQEYE